MPMTSAVDGSGAINTVTYYWEYSNDNGTSWTPISSSNSTTYDATETGSYRRAYQEAGCDVVYSNVINITRPTPAQAGTVSYAGDMDTTVCSGKTLTLALNGNTAYTLNWQYSTDGGSTWTNFTNPFSQVVNQDYRVRYLAQMSSTCLIHSANDYVITKADLPVVNSISQPTDLCPGQTSYPVTASITSSGTITEYTWTGATGTNENATVTATLPNCGKPYYYSLKVKNEFGCESVVKDGSFTTLTPTVTFGTPSTQTASLVGSNCVVPNLKSVIESVASSTCSNPVVSYTCIPTEGSIVPDGSTINVTATVTDFCGSTHTVVIPVKADACAPSSECPLNITADNITVCEGTSAELTATASGTGATGTATYTWTPTSVTVVSDNVVRTPTTATPGTATYTCEVSFSSGCTSSKSIDITTIAKPSESNRTGEICTGESYSYGTSGVTYTWTVTDAAGTDATAQATAQSQFDVTLNNTGTASAVVIYSVTPHKTVGTTDCTGDPFTVTLTVKPSIANDAANFKFNAPEVNITLWNGACDTLYDFTTEPTYTTTISEYSSSLTITNNYSTSNTGTLMGRIPQGDNVIVWTVTDPCGNSLTFDQHIIVSYQPCTGTVSDGEYTYDVVRVGCECWTASNSRKSATKTFVYKSHEFPDETANEEKFGKLYTWYSAVGVTEDDDNATPTEITDPTSGIKYVQGICPDGWAIPSASSYDNMIATAGGTDNVKSFDATTWLPGYAGNNPGSGFNAKGAGYYNNDIDRYENILSQTDFWTVSTGATVQNGICSEITHTCPQSLTKSYDKGRGFSVRCVKRAND
jgi:Fibrobacter succinogenes major domain (Fib_succ_major).